MFKISNFRADQRTLVDTSNETCLIEPQAKTFKTEYFSVLNNRKKRLPQAVGTTSLCDVNHGSLPESRRGSLLCSQGVECVWW